MQLVRAVIIFGLWTAVRLVGQAPGISDVEALQLPTSQRLGVIQTGAQRDGWAPQVMALRGAAAQAYRQDKLAAAEAWFRVYRWAALFAESEATFVPRWMRAVENAKVAHPNMPLRYSPKDRPLGLLLAPELQSWMIGHAAFSADFFELLSPLDYVPNAFQILDAIFRDNPGRFKAYANLALAIAVVFDVPPPPNWPHGQVTDSAFPRKLPAPADAFAWWVKQDQLGHGYHKLTKLGADELKFVVDAAAPFGELEWAAKISDYPLSQLARAYTMVRYRAERVANNQPIWLGRTYRLPEILATGGICCDQAYFATQVGKSRGVPTLLFHGAGNDGRHAWFGFLDGSQKWQLDAGRYAEQRFVTGYARDPQTWREISDHELQFLSEGFRALPAFRQALLHANVAADCLATGDASTAATAARKAVNFERRHQPAWDTLIAAGRKLGREAKVVEAVMREAALAFHRYPDLEAHYIRLTADSLRARGETSLADAEVLRITSKNKRSRSDLGVQQARDTVLRSFTVQPLAQQIQTFNSVLDNAGRGGGIAFFDHVVVVFAEHMLQLQQPAEAVRAVERARRTLKVEPDSQLEQELAKLLAELKTKK